MVRLLENRLKTEYTDKDSRIPGGIWDAQNAAHLLIAYYQKTSSKVDVNRVLETLGGIVYSQAALAEPMTAQAWLESYSRLCRDHGRHDLTTKAIQAVLDLGPKVKGSLKRFGVDLNVPEDEMTGYLANFTNRDLPHALRLLATAMVPKWDSVVSSTNDNAKQLGHPANREMDE